MYDLGIGESTGSVVGIQEESRPTSGGFFFRPKWAFSIGRVACVSDDQAGRRQWRERRSW